MACEWCGEDSLAAFCVGGFMVCFGCGRDAQKAAAAGAVLGRITKFWPDGI